KISASFFGSLLASIEPVPAPLVTGALDVATAPPAVSVVVLSLFLSPHATMNPAPSTSAASRTWLKLRIVVFSSVGARPRRGAWWRRARVQGVDRKSGTRGARRGKSKSLNAEVAEKNGEVAEQSTSE